MSFGMQGSKMPTGAGYGNKIPKGMEMARIQNFTPEMMQLFQQMIGNLGPDSFLSKIAGGDQSAFEEMEAPAHRQFNEKIGGLASRFSGQGMGARRSSGFQNESSAAASNFAQDLQSRRVDMRNQAMRDLQSMGNELLRQKPYNQSLVEEETPWWKEMISGAMPYIGAGIGSLAGPAGTAIGGAAGSYFGNKFGGGGNRLGIQGTGSMGSNAAMRMRGGF